MKNCPGAQNSIRLIGIILHGSATDAVAVHMILITQQVLQHYRIVILGPVLNAVTVGDAVANAGNLDLPWLGVAGLGNTRKTIEVQEGNTGCQNQYDNQDDDRKYLNDSHYRSNLSDQYYQFP